MCQVLAFSSYISTPYFFQHHHGHPQHDNNMATPAAASAISAPATVNNEPTLRTPNNKLFSAHRAYPLRYSPAVRSKLAGLGPTVVSAPLHLTGCGGVSGIKPLTPHNRATSSPVTAPSSASSSGTPTCPTIGGAASSSSSSGVSFFTTPNNSLQRRAAMAASRFHIFQAANSTPPSRTASGACAATAASRVRMVHNPFEAALVERLHLPLICSPSLFHRPATPQHSSTQFEWTIDDVSALNPTNVEAHETQFLSVIDPEQEARAQAAISTYFKEMLTVPSPVDCPLRKQNIASLMPAACKRNKALAAPKPRRHDAECQTMLTLPPQLPAGLEELLRPFCTYTQEQQQEHRALVGVDAEAAPGNKATNSSDGEDEPVIDHDARDASLRRKLFNTSPVFMRGGLSDSDSDRQLLDGVELVNMSPPPASPQLVSCEYDNAQQDVHTNRQCALSPKQTHSDRRQRNFQSPHDREQRSSHQHSFRVSLSPVRATTTAASQSINRSRRRRTTGPDDSPSSFGSLSPIACGVANNTTVTSGSRIERRRSSAGVNASMTSTASTSSRPLNNRSWRSRKSSSSTHDNSSSAFCQSTPGNSANSTGVGRYRTCGGSLGGTLGGSLEHLTLSSSSKSLGRSRSRLTLDVEPPGQQYIGDDAWMASAESVHECQPEQDELIMGLPVEPTETGASDDTVDEDEEVEIDLDDDIVLDGSPNSSCSQHSGTPTRKVRWAKRKNLSLSFGSTSLFEDDGFEAADEDRDDNSELSGIESVVDGAILDKVVESGGNTVAELTEEQLDKLAETAAKGLCQTDSGFNDIDV